MATHDVYSRQSPRGKQAKGPYMKFVENSEQKWPDSGRFKANLSVYEICRGFGVENGKNYSEFFTFFLFGQTDKKSQCFLCKLLRFLKLLRIRTRKSDFRCKGRKKKILW